MLSLFCFCKQRTAYEMRISDWSSDVCSSDLLAGGDHAQRRLAAVGEQVLHVAHLHAGGMRAQQAAVAAASIGHVAGVVHRSRREIGRASCRERVCQYVYNSVVAGSLKQQWIQHNTSTVPYHTNYQRIL